MANNYSALCTQFQNELNTDKESENRINRIWERWWNRQTNMHFLLTKPNTKSTSFLVIIL